MKKLIIALAMSFVAIVGLQAQTQFKPGVGLNFSNISGEGADASAQVGWQLGASLAFGDKFYIEPGAFYQTTSMEYFDKSTPSSTVVDLTYSGVRVPLAVGLDILGDADTALGVRVFGGGSGYFVTGASDGLNKDDIESPQWGVFAGAGLDLTIFYLDLSYQWSLNNLQTDVSQIDLGKSRSFFLTAGLRF